MSSFQQRKAVGDAHEQRVARELTRRGWHVDPWGQGVLSNVICTALRSTRSSLRWLPDLIAAKDQQIALIDCKSRMTSRTTGRHAVERSAVTAHLQLVAWWLLPVYYVFDNLDVLAPYDVLTNGTGGPRTQAGSGTPYLLTPTAHSLPFNDVFGTASRTGSGRADAA